MCISTESIFFLSKYGDTGETEKDNKQKWVNTTLFLAKSYSQYHLTYSKLLRIKIKIKYILK